LFRIRLVCRALIRGDTRGGLTQDPPPGGDKTTPQGRFGPTIGILYLVAKKLNEFFIKSRPTKDLRHLFGRFQTELVGSFQLNHNPRSE